MTRPLPPSRNRSYFKLRHKTCTVTIEAPRGLCSGSSSLEHHAKSRQATVDRQLLGIYSINSLFFVWLCRRLICFLLPCFLGLAFLCFLFDGFYLQSGLPGFFILSHCSTRRLPNEKPIIHKMCCFPQILSNLILIHASARKKNICMKNLLPL